MRLFGAIVRIRESNQCNYFGSRDSTSRTMMEEILANDGEHADELSDLLFAISPAPDPETRRLYFADEISAKPASGDSEARSAQR
jgi:hypothetical protein